eukprot:scaffold16856_cov60-Phaeocystis_antarctica.AAC.4
MRVVGVLVVDRAHRLLSPLSSLESRSVPAAKDSVGKKKRGDTGHGQGTTSRGRSGISRDPVRAAGSW